MLDLGFVRSHLAVVEENLRQRGMDADAMLGNFRQLDERRRQIITASETLNARRNRAAEQVARLKREGQDASDLVAATKSLKEQGEELQKQATQLDEQLHTLLAGIPNVPHSSVPVGHCPEQNLELRRWGTPRKFNFNPKPHWEIGEALGVLDMERAAKLSGARFALYWDHGAKLERALANFMLDVHTSEHGYTEVLPPYMVNSASMFGTGQLPKFARDLFHCENTDLWLVPTAEVPLTNIYRDEIIAAEKLPLSLTAYTPCFRSEAGSYGKDVRGLIRQHQFQKVELVKFARPENSYQEHEKLTRDAEAILQKLELPYRVMLLCTGDMGFAAAKTYDLEVWLPGQKLFREISSCSNFEAFQSRRANIRYKPGGKSRTDFVHTLNGSGLAIGRTWLALLENYQQADGSVLLPESLRPYMGGAERLRARTA